MSHAESSSFGRLARGALLAAFAAGAGCHGGRSGTPSPAGGRFPGLEQIREADLRRDLFTLAGDDFRGREAGTLDELRASAWLAEQARAIGLAPAGDDGTYFQFWPMRRIRTGDESRIAIGSTALAFGVDLAAVEPVNARIDAPIVFVGDGKPGDLEGVDLNGKIAAAMISPPSVPIPANVGLRPVRYAWATIAERSRDLLRRGAAGVIMIADAVADSAWGFASSWYSHGGYTIDSVPRPLPGLDGRPVLWARPHVGDLVRRPGQRLTGTLIAQSFLYPSVNVVAKLEGTDPALKSEYVLFSGHQDHDGVRSPVDGDSIYNGADDNGTVSVALLAIGRSFVRHPGRRSALFVWHGAEERGLLGSRWYAAHPTVPKSAIVAVLNGDMIGSNRPDSAALLGVQPPHRNSSDLVALGLEANRLVGHFALDTVWDKPGHPEGWYFRSDHVPYAYAGIPAIYYSTLPHPLYHTPKDEPSRINYPKLTRMTQWIYATGWLVANQTVRPRVDPGFKLER